jgi:soluble lytic murein transglycosylase-like protein
MNNRTLAALTGMGIVAYLLYSQRQTVTSSLQSAAEEVQAAVSGWKNVNAGPQWVPVLNAAEAQFGIPADLLARMAYQESAFRPEYISGSKASSAGALGIMQLEPAYFSTVRVPVPFTDSDTAAQIQQAAQELARLYGVFSDWGLAVGAYNDGQGNMSAYLSGTKTLPDETIKYVSQVLSDVPVAGATIPS